MNTFKVCLKVIVTAATLLWVSAWAQTGWEIQFSGTSNALNAVYFLNPDTGWVVGASGTILHTTDGGFTWNPIGFPSSADLNDLYFFNPDTGLVVGADGVFRTTDGGVSWTNIPTGITDPLLSVSFFDNWGIAGAFSQSIIYSQDGGQSWSVAQSGFFGGGFYGAIMLSPSLGFVGGENSIFQPLVGKSSNGGATWTFHAFYLSNNEGRIYSIDFTDEFIGYAASRLWDGRGAISKTQDGGANWTTSIFSEPLYGIDFPISNASLIGYAVGANGTIYKTMDAGTFWLPLNSGTTARLNDVYFLHLDLGYVVGETGTILKTTTGGEPPIDVDEDQKGVSAIQTPWLYQNAPNPFNPKTLIQFYLPNRVHVQLEVFNFLGQIVSVLVDQPMAAGTHTVQFDGSCLSSGIYWYRLQAGSYRQVRKMLLVK
ncbi:MAG: hypothetical protein Kow0042_01210 [Calditrichia bacterium]